MVHPRARGRTQQKKRSGFRQEVVDLHREIFRSNRARINESVFGYTDAFRRYERTYQRGVQSYERRTTYTDLDRTLTRASVAYFGDYHTLAQAQRSFLRLVRRLPKTRPITIALEVIMGKHQKALDEFLAGDIDEAGFLKLIGPDAHWVFGGWPNFKELFDLAKERGYRVIGIDTASRGPAGSSLQARDDFAAKRITKELDNRPDALVMVLIGELHIAPSHLPRAVDKAAKRAVPRAIIYQNCEEIYWQLEERGLEHEVEIVRLGKDTFCVLNTPPIVCQQSFLNWLDVDEGIPELAAPEQNFKEYASVIAEFFELNIGDALDEVELASVVDLSFLSRLRRRGDFSDADMREIKRQILRSESYYIPRARMVYLGNLSVNHASEEATHFIRHVCANNNDPKTLVDAFYARCLEEAIGFLGSKLLNHKRKCAHPPHFEKVLRAKNATAADKEMARLVLGHVTLEGGKRVKGLSRIYETDADMFNAVTHVLGYRLGDQLYYALVRGLFDKAEIRALFFDPWEDEGAALTTYFYLASRVREVQVPERL